MNGPTTGCSGRSAARPAAEPGRLGEVSISIEVPQADWGGASVADVGAVARSVAVSFEGALSERAVEAIRVEPTSNTNSSPFVAFDRADSGHVRVFLSARGTYWAQYAYQFAHELCHVMANYRPPQQHHWKWFEESLCEMGSLFAIKRMAEAWATSPPYPNWAGFACHLKQYVDERCSKPEHRVPVGESFCEWLRKRLEDLQKDACQRADNTVVARELLPIFEANHDAWRAVRYFNLWQDRCITSISELCDRWRQVTPESHHCHIDSVEGRLTCRS